MSAEEKSDVSRKIKREKKSRRAEESDEQEEKSDVSRGTERSKKSRRTEESDEQQEKSDLYRGTERGKKSGRATAGSSAGPSAPPASGPPAAPRRFSRPSINSCLWSNACDIDSIKHTIKGLLTELSEQGHTMRALIMTVTGLQEDNTGLHLDLTNLQRTINEIAMGLHEDIKDLQEKALWLKQQIAAIKNDMPPQPKVAPRILRAAAPTPRPPRGKCGGSTRHAEAGRLAGHGEAHAAP